jgi:hypothetical protein
MKRFIMWLPIALAITSVASADDEFYEGKLKFRSAGTLTEFDDANAACQAGVKQLESQGNHQQFLRTKEGTDDKKITCVLKNLNLKAKPEWDQIDSVTKLVKCNDGTEGISTDRSGTFVSLKCRCPDSGCPRGRSAPTPRKTPTCPAKNAENPVCKAKKAPPGIEDSARCKQQPARSVTKEQAKLASRINQDKLRSNDTGREIAARYKKALAEITKDEEEKRAINTGRDHTGEAFPKFTADDMCDTGGVTDVNIGMLCGSREADFAAANNMAGLATTPTAENAPNLDCVWHHHEELGRMQLVKRKAHQDQPHTGGVKVWEQAMGIPDYPLCCP